MKIPLIVGVVALIFTVGVAVCASDFTAYLGNIPSTCNNCHVMDDAYEGWYHAGHKPWTTCNECHTPHALIPKYWVKAISGYHHVSTFFFGDIPDAIRAKESSRKIVQENCKRCHETTITNLDWEVMYNQYEEERYCIDCHRSQAHGSRGISILPYQHMEINQ
jgi:cytochrome c nitrite reductase small subunit